MNGARALLFALAAQVVLAAPLMAQAGAADSVRAPASSQVQRPDGSITEDAPLVAGGDVDIITPHITDSDKIDLPCWNHATLVCEHDLPKWKPIVIGGFAIDMSPTKHVVMLFVAAFLCLLVLVPAARAHTRHSHAIGRPKGFAAGIEAMVLYIRQEVAIPNLGHHGERYAPFVLTLFFFILFANMLGLIPYGSTPTGNISVTLMLALVTFVVVEVAGMRALGRKYISTVVYWNTELPLYMRIPLAIIMTPIEIIGKFTKPFALTIRLFANMTAGHIVVLALIGLIFFFHNVISGAPFIMAVLIMMLELFVALLQAFIFALLSAVFIGQIREAAH
ncbi:MAG: F0F1 ATP synthase subunit A [Gemmatimonadaceae bacterium]